MKDGRHIIWSNDIDYDDWREDLEEQYPDLTEAERMELMYVFIVGALIFLKIRAKKK